MAEMRIALIVLASIFGLLATTCALLLKPRFTMTQRAKFPLLKVLDGKQVHLVVGAIVFGILSAAAVALRLLIESPASLGPQTARNNGIAQALGPGSNATVNIYAYTPEQLQALIDAVSRGEQQDAEQTKKIDELRQELGVTRESLVRILRNIGIQQVPPEQLTKTFSNIVQNYKSLLEDLAAIEAPDPTSRILVNEARGVLVRSDSSAAYAEADKLLERAETNEIRAARAADSQEAADRRRLSAANIRVGRGDLSESRLDYLGAANHFQKASDLMPTTYIEQRADYRDRHASALLRYADLKGDRATLAQAIDSYKTLLLDLPRDRAPLFWAATTSNLGSALGTLGEYERDLKRLGDAMAAFRHSQTVYTREDFPLQWAGAQGQIASALATIGQIENSTDYLDRAVSAHKEALGELKRGRAREWVIALAQNNLGNTLAELGRRENGAARLEEGVMTFCESLAVRTRKDAPFDWAVTQNNMATTLRILAEKTKRISCVQEALVRYRTGSELFRLAKAMSYLKGNEASQHKAEAILQDLSHSTRGILDIPCTTVVEFSRDEAGYPTCVLPREVH